ncbi:Hypothetical predicted protein [Olea europaea subsp. europaea]|uniref:Uncharacterized protein n=1 Tax=Olea europaea subsp. europaea TaxID=158383 RepID=A0A8S0V3H7_OLEEU|nr:Hypothetical predicted protein [Olea europaea subsp. europaea]
MADDNTTNSIGEIKEETPLISTQTLDPSPLRTRSVSTKVLEAEVHVYRQGKGPIEVFKTDLGRVGPGLAGDPRYSQQIWVQDGLRLQSRVGLRHAHPVQPP